MRLRWFVKRRVILLYFMSCVCFLATAGYVFAMDECPNPDTTWYSDDDGDGFSDGDILMQCEDPGMTRYLSGGTLPVGLSNLLGYRSYNIGDGTDDSGNARTASLNRGATGVQGIYGTGIELDGSTDNITIPHSSAFNVTEMTFASRVYLDANTNDRISLAHKSKASWPAWQFYARSNYGAAPGYPVFEIDVNNDNVGTTNEQVFGASILQINTRYHLVGTYDGTTLSIYQDGDLIESKTVAGSIPTTTNPIRIGANQLRGEYLDGRVDETYFYDRALTSGEIAILYANSSILIATGDCDDTVASINIAATEICDGIDNDCDGIVDDGLTTTYYQDSDEDGYGNPGVTTGSCAGIPMGYTGDNTDCNDSAVTVYSGATEICDGIDNDCDSIVDDDLTTTYYQDSDEDGYGNPGVTTGSCAGIPMGYTGDNTDCNDSAVTVYSGATEICDELDNDCDSFIDNLVVGLCAEPVRTSGKQSTVSKEALMTKSDMSANGAEPGDDEPIPGLSQGSDSKTGLRDEETDRDTMSDAGGCEELYIFADVPEDVPFYDAVMSLRNGCAVQGRMIPDDSMRVFGPYRATTRGELYKMIVILFFPEALPINEEASGSTHRAVGYTAVLYDKEILSSAEKDNKYLETFVSLDEMLLVLQKFIDVNRQQLDVEQYKGYQVKRYEAVMILAYLAGR